MSIDRIAPRRIESCTILPSFPQQLKREKGRPWDGEAISHEECTEICRER